jgi:hypothetical protein
MGVPAPVLATVLGRGIIRTVTVSRVRAVDVLVGNKSNGDVSIEEEGVESENGEEGTAKGADVESTGIFPGTLTALETELDCDA